MAIDTHKLRFLDTVTEADALKFGEFELKSGRISPYFFNAGNLNQAGVMLTISNAYASALIKTNIEFDMVFGPAYKGIPLAATIVSSLGARGGYDSVVFGANRKEKKTHGDVSEHLGAHPKDKRIIIADDVITAGTSFNESIEFITKNGGTVVGGIVMVDRREKGRKDNVDLEMSAIQEIEKTHGFPIHAIVTVDDILTYAGNKPELQEYAPKIEAYRAKYGVQ